MAVIKKKFATVQTSIGAVNIPMFWLDRAVSDNESVYVTLDEDITVTVLSTGDRLDAGFPFEYGTKYWFNEGDAYYFEQRAFELGTHYMVAIKDANDDDVKIAAYTSRPTFGLIVVDSNNVSFLYFDSLGSGYTDLDECSIGHLGSMTITAGTSMLCWNNDSGRAAAVAVISSAQFYDDPYENAGTTGTGGGEGTFDGTSDAISIPSLPTLSAVDTGLITLYNPTIAQLNSLASYMWAGAFDVATFKKIFADPMDAILGLSVVPVAVASGGSGTVHVGNISTGITMDIAASQYVEVDCGTLNVQEYWGSYLDYAPYTKAELYLPYIGTRPIDIDDIMGKSVQVVYHVDIMSGACSAFVKCGSSVLYNFIGQCSSSIPITGNDWTNVINGVISAGVSLGSMVATSGMTAPMAVPQLASTAVNSMKPSIEKSGAMAGTGGMMSIQTPYLILTRPRQALPEKQNEYTGYPSFITSELSTLQGYTEIEEIHLEGIPATDAELTEIESLLKGGVIL